MIAELGHFALTLAFALAVVQTISGLVGAHQRAPTLLSLSAPSALLQFALVAFSFGCLTYSFVVSDFSVSNVANNSHTLKPLIYKISGVWGNHEGSLLLWIFILAIFGAAVAWFGRPLPMTLHGRVLGVQGLIGVGFLAFLLWTSNPFERIFPAPADGSGLNPLLQDPGLALHPPFLYLGYVGLSTTFSFAIAALLEGKVDPAWARWVRPWTLAAWCALTAGIGLGSWWAYYELGWGGFWFWDPVENASFMPWLAATALLHSAIVVEKRDTLKAWTIFLAIVAFAFSLLGTFLVRSGVLTSVHAFATDPERGVFILLLLVIAIGGSFTLYAWRAPTLQPTGIFAPISREGALVVNNLLLSTATVTVLLGTLFPLILDLINGSKITVGPPFFNATFIPIMAPLVALMAIGPFLSWKRADLAGVLQRLRFVVLVTVILTLLWTAYFSPTGIGLSGLGVLFGVWLVLGTLYDWAERAKLFGGSFKTFWSRARGLPRSTYGMTFAHLGLGIIILGIVGATTWTQEVLTVVEPGKRYQVGDYEYRFIEAGPIKGPNYRAVEGQFEVYRDGELITRLSPETRQYNSPPMETTEAAIHPLVTGDLFVAMGDQTAANGGYTARLYFRPFMSWVWVGTLLMVLGGLISLSDRRLRIASAQRSKAKLATTAQPKPTPEGSAHA